MSESQQAKSPWLLQLPRKFPVRKASEGWCSDLKTTLEKRLLLVDDDQDTLESISQGLRVIFGATVINASSGRDALEKLASNEVDAMVTDFRMPGMDGIELARQALRLRPHLPIVMITAYNDEDLQNEAEAAGICEIVPKPIDLEPLVTVVIDCC